MPNKLKLRQLEGFVAAADTGSFVLAASHMAMSPPAFSQSIRELEASLGVALFDRTTRRVDLTAAGQQLLHSVRRPLQDLDHAYAEMRALAVGNRGRVAFSILHSLAFGIGTRALAALRAQHPSISVQMIEDQNDVLVERVMNREVDFGLGMFTHASDELSFEPLFVDELVAVFPKNHPLRKAGQVEWAELAASPLILLPQKSSVRRLVEASILVTGMPRQPVHEVVSMVTAINMASAGLGITILPQLSLGSLNLRNLIARPIGEPKPYRQIGILRQAARPVLEAERVALAQIRREAGQAEGVLPRLP
ncbi:LysR family transcriptional regulator [Bordetella genomosp. 13]|uniref:LysR family transcriptional regulator n=1 Tax=Bordetella genomosp. 13 TaxID=463040 RepID=UPI00119FAA34|nr:LysR family transcriptional regulator [Bordetella genomosp. 13]